MRGKRDIRDRAQARFYDELRTRLATIPGVRSVTAANMVLDTGSVSTTLAYVPGSEPHANNDIANLDVGPAFFTTLQIPILLGREDR